MSTPARRKLIHDYKYIQNVSKKISKKDFNLKNNIFTLNFRNLYGAFFLHLLKTIL